MSATNQLSDLQLAILRVLWQAGEATVAQVHSSLLDERGLAVTTVATILSRLERRGLVGHRREGRQFVYQALISAREVRRSMLSELTDRVYQGNVTELVSHLLSNRDLNPGDLARVKQMIEAHEHQPAPSAVPSADQERSDVD